MEALWNIEIAITLFFQQIGGWLALPMKAFSFLGQEQFFLVIIPALYWCFDSVLGLRVGVMLTLSYNLFGFFKIIFHSPRPYWVSNKVHAYLSESSFGFPSGHAQGAASIWGLLATSFKKRWFTILSIAIIFLIGLSRIYLGVHFTSDVLVGWIFGGLLVLLFVKLERPVLKQFNSWRFVYQICTLFIVSMVMILIYYLAIASLSSWTLPATWSANSLTVFPNQPIDPLDPASAFTTAGTFFGMTAGAAWLFRFRPDLRPTGGSERTRVLRYLTGLIGMIVIYVGLSLLFPHDSSLTSLCLRYLRYMLLGSYVSALAPMLFARIGLLGTKIESVPSPVKTK
jgi:membrane-associated phospholipid phosphatase